MSVTEGTRKVAAAIAGGHNWGLGIINETGLAMSTVYAMLSRMRQQGWVTWQQESPAAALAAGRTPRTLYTLTSKAERILEQHRPRGRPAGVGERRHPARSL